MSGEQHIRDYFCKLDEAVCSKDGVAVAECLAMNSTLLDFSRHGDVERFLDRIDIPRACTAGLPPSFALVCSNYLQARLARKHFIRAFEHYKSMMIKFLDTFAATSGKWLAPVVATIARDGRILAQKADAMSDDCGGEEKYTQECAGQLQKAFATCMTDRAGVPKSKKWAVIGVVVNLFKIYFRVQKLRLCRNLTRAVDKLPMKLSDFPKAEQVTYNFFIGKLLLYSGSTARAEERFTRAYETCLATCQSHLRSILTCLVPCKLALGYLPNEKLLRTHNLGVFLPIVSAIRSGNMLQFRQCVDQHLDYFARYRILTLVESLELLVLRSLVRRILHIHAPKTNLRLTPIVAAFNISFGLAGSSPGSDGNEEAKTDADGKEMSTLEVACLLSNLIAKGMLKAYISHSHQMLVVSAKCPFPDLHPILLRTGQ